MPRSAYERQRDIEFSRRIASRGYTYSAAVYLRNRGWSLEAALFLLLGIGSR